jgi:hypothetical protein
MDLNIPDINKDNQSIENIDNKWLNNFLTEKSHISSTDSSIQSIAKVILSSDTLKALVRERYLNGNRFLGWTVDGSKGLIFLQVTLGLEKQQLELNLLHWDMNVLIQKIDICIEK